MLPTSLGTCSYVGECFFGLRLYELLTTFPTPLKTSNYVDDATLAGWGGGGVGWGGAGRGGVGRGGVGGAGRGEAGWSEVGWGGVGWGGVGQQ